MHRLQQILDLAVKYRRKVVFSGRSMINVAEAASKIGELKIPENIMVDADKLKNFRDNEILIISTGSQGEPMSALTRMATGEFNKVTIGANDTIVISASPIPGNEKMIYGVINNLYRKGAEVIYESLEPIHVSGHACQGEIKILHSLVKPKFFIPVHGEYRHLKKHARLAVDMGVKKSNVLIADIGNTVELTSKTMTFGENFPSGTRLVDGLGIDGSESVVLKDRIHLSEDGLLVVVVGSSEEGRAVCTDIINRGILLDDKLMEEIRQNVNATLAHIDVKAGGDKAAVKNAVRRGIKNHLFRRTKKNPMILPIIMDVKSESFRPQSADERGRLFGAAGCRRKGRHPHRARGNAAATACGNCRPYAAKNTGNRHGGGRFRRGDAARRGRGETGNDRKKRRFRRARPRKLPRAGAGKAGYAF